MARHRPGRKSDDDRAESKTVYVVVRKDLDEQLRTMSDHEMAPGSVWEAVAAKAWIGLSETGKALRFGSSGCGGWALTKVKSRIHFTVIRRTTSNEK